MVEPLPRWAKGLVVGVVAVGLMVTALRMQDDGLGAPRPADWRVAPDADLSPTTRRVPVLVLERACASGRAADGRVEAEVTYERAVVAIDIRVKPLGGDEDCQGNPATPFVVTLVEPLGNRTIAGERGLVP